MERHNYCGWPCGCWHLCLHSFHLQRDFMFNSLHSLPHRQKYDVHIFISFQTSLEIVQDYSQNSTTSIPRASKLLSNVSNDFKTYHFIIGNQLENDKDAELRWNFYNCYIIGDILSVLNIEVSQFQVYFYANAMFNICGTSNYISKHA